MMLIAKKPCTFGGQKFKIGDEIPAELVMNPKLQERRGVIAIAADVDSIPAQEDVVKFTIPIHTENGDIDISVTNAELSVFTDILQIGVSKTEDKQKISEMIQNIESEDLLIMLDALDGRKFVKDEVQARVDAMKAPEEDPEQTDLEQTDLENPEGEQENPEGDA